MKINFTKKQYEDLLKLVYLGEWMVNAIRTGQKDDPRIEKFDEIEQYIYSFAKDLGLEKCIEYDKEMKRYFPTREFEEETDIEKYREDYDEHVFWEELFYRLSDRDFCKKYSKDEIMKMEMRERFEKEEPFRKKWDEEIDKHGIERLEAEEL